MRLKNLWIAIVLQLVPGLLLQSCNDSVALTEVASPLLLKDSLARVDSVFDPLWAPMEVERNFPEPLSLLPMSISDEPYWHSREDEVYAE